MQEGLALASSALMARTGALQTTLDRVITYQRSSRAMLACLLGRCVGMGS